MVTASQVDDGARSNAALDAISTNRKVRYAGEWVLSLGLVLAISLYLWQFVYRNWIPHDEGMLGQAAERVLQGELPHRDFDDMYTGALSFMHAAAFRALGIALSSCRTVLFLASLWFGLAVYAVARRAADPWAAALLSFTVVIWSVPNWFSPLATWYVLFAMTFGLWASLRYVDTGRWYWLLAAGLCGGIAITFKIVGLYYVGAVALFLVYRGQLLAFSQIPSLRSRLVSCGGVSLVCVIYIALLVALLRHNLTPMVIVQFLLPATLMAGTLPVHELLIAGGSLNRRVSWLLRTESIFFAGVALPVVIFGIPYAVSGSLHQLLDGVFIKPQLRLEHATWPLAPGAILVLVLPLAFLLSTGFLPLFRRRGTAVFLAGVFALAAAPSLVVSSVAQVAFLCVQCVVPAGVMLACYLLLSKSKRLSLQRKQEVFLVAALAAFGVLFQYPFALPIYFCYVAPLVILMVAYLFACQDGTRVLHWSLLGWCLVFALVQLNRPAFFAPARFHELLAADRPGNRLDLRRAGLFVRRSDKEVYEKLIPLIQRHSAEDSVIYAAPDCPQIYFLSQRRNPTRTMFDFFDGRDSVDVAWLEEMPIRVLVVNLRPRFTQGRERVLAEYVQRRFSHVERVGDFLVGYSDQTDASAKSVVLSRE